MASPASIASPENHEQNGIPVAAPPEELSDHLYPVNHSNGIPDMHLMNEKLSMGRFLYKFRDPFFFFVVQEFLPL